jgi:pimeloyl-ACP methyl ester carboxylesterase
MEHGCVGRREFLGAAAGPGGLAGLDALAGPAATLGAPRTRRRPATFVLVHGGWRGGWCWRRVADRLTARGHRVYAPTLTGLGERSHLRRPDLGLSTHVDDVVNLFAWEELSDVVLCGHSYGGMVTTAVTARLPGRIRSIVYLDAFLPRDGESLLDSVPAAMRTRFEDAAARRDGYVPPPPASAFLVNAADRAWVDGKCTPQPIATFREPARGVAAVDGIARKSYVFASRYDAPAFRAVADRVREDRSWKLHEVASGHDLMVDLPDRVTALLEEAA